jgi:hypothetical protein
MGHMKTTYGKKQFIKAMVYKANAYETNEIYCFIEKLMKGKYYVPKGEKKDGC